MSPQVWLITGTSSGFGAEFVKSAIARGDKVIATARNVEKINHLKDIGAATMQLDVTASQAELDRKANEAISMYGRIDVLVNNAGYTQFGTIEESSHEEWFTQFNTNVFGTLNTTRSFLPHFRSNKSGAIVFIGSMVAWDGVPIVGAYCASKAALHCTYPLEDMSEIPANTVADSVESLQKEVGPLGIKTLLVEPGTFRTDLLAATNRKSAQSKYAIADYKALTEAVENGFASLDGNQIGDPVKGVALIIDLVKGKNVAAGKEWPSQLPIGSDAVGVIRKKCEETLRELEQWEELAKSTDA
ncbi:hypothetical protein N7448_002402 [Penicillium atrosanguineum]|uniref:Uncharacterized protein n=1 Tax=Penicillium atrosanguineum TaxID=1132637 RepID=A0A9W9HDN2_9EURO|nr:uncharacterized protein N7443_005804 [Penicillium atrosanguineum]KAJ5128685.1 hypothetical protein N7526_006851 [Penicillium atrosanguineum]KAJ5145010.1 hypothetical protein N7448_002402 [Penicillium atrosanguineum]KAJ5300802.1 hypothetical protein N7443_005804 [Penicillium atrosanguineum]KAJ5311444.1 hypothetical protein N7476_007304 [Penicillium atrosanguineum]